MAKPINPALLTVRVNAAARLLRYQQALAARTARLLAAHEQIQEDLRAAGDMQRSLLPTKRLDAAGCIASPLFIPSQHVSGDMYNYFELGEGLVGFYGADVAGHGVRAALLAATLGHTIDAALFQASACGLNARPSPRRLVEDLNRRFVSDSEEQVYFTLVAGVIDVPRHMLTLCQAGHPHPLVLRRDGESLWLGKGGFPVGLFDDAQFAEFSIPFHGGDRLVVYSDGVTEAMNGHDEEFGNERLLRYLVTNRHEPAETLGLGLATTLDAWSDGHGLRDDISMIIFEYQES